MYQFRNVVENVSFNVTLFKSRNSTMFLFLVAPVTIVNRSDRREVLVKPLFTLIPMKFLTAFHFR